MTTKSLLTPTEVWSAKIYSNGWKKPGLGTADVIEKATGAKLGEVGVASTEDMSAAAAAARKAQKEWAKLPGPNRGDVLREFSRLMHHAMEFAVHPGRASDRPRPRYGQCRDPEAGCADANHRRRDLRPAARRSRPAQWTVPCSARRCGHRRGARQGAPHQYDQLHGLD